MGYDRIERKDASGLEKPEVPAELKKMLDDAKTALQALDTKADDTKRNALKALEKYEDLNSKYVSDIQRFETEKKAAEKKAAELGSEVGEFKQRVKDLEVQIATKGFGAAGKDDPRDTPEVKAWYGWFGARPESKELADNRALVERKQMELKDAGLLRTDDLTRGGYLIPPVTASRVLEKIVEISPTRAFAASMPLSSKNMNIPVEKAVPDAYYEGEADEAAQGNLQFGEESVTAWRQTVVMALTYDQLFMSPFDMESRITTAVGKGFAKKESWMLINGDGNKKPQGWIKHPEASSHTILSKATGNISWDDFAQIMGEMKVGYDPMFFFGRKSFAQIVQIKDTMGRPIWSPVAGEKPATIWDQPYSSKFIDMDQLGFVDSTHNATSNTIPIAYADLSAGFMNFDVQNMSVIRDDVTQAAKSIIKYTFRRWHTSKVVMPEAIKLLKVR